MNDISFLTMTAMTDAPLLQELHPELFHYTSVAGLESILKTQYLWSTHWQHLNDDHELEHFKDLLPHLIDPSKQSFILDITKNFGDHKEEISQLKDKDEYWKKLSKSLTQGMADAVVNSDPKKQLFEFYVTSFSKVSDHDGINEHGALSQWRYYGQNGGYALVFDTAELEILKDQEIKRWRQKITLGEVGYSNESSEVLKSRINALSELVQIINAENFLIGNDYSPMFSPLIQCFVHYKHWCFSEEREVRLATMLNGPEIRKINANNGIAAEERKRYYEAGAPRIHLFEGLEVKDRPYRLPIKRIIVGPGPTQRERKRKLRGLLDVLGYDIPVTLADMPIHF